MGSNRRYAAAVDARMDSRILEMLMREHAPIGLNDAELELDIEPVTRPPAPVPVQAWVRYGPTAISVNGWAVAWTPRAVAVRWTTPHGVDHRAWLWASAVRRAPRA